MWRTRKKSSAALVLTAMLASGCSTFLPYESDFACKNDDYGQCVHPEAAYRDALGATPGATVKDAAKESEDEPLSGETPPARAQGYEGYQQAQYDQLAALIEAPVTPMVAPAKTIRTLILPYADKASGARLYMPRFVYSVLEQPRFVLGDYLYGKRDDFAGAIARGLMVNSRSSDGRGGAPQNLFDATSSQTPRDRLGGE